MSYSKEFSSAMGSVVIRTYRDGDEEQILELFSLVFQKEKCQDTWRWQFIKNPYGTQIMLAFLEGQLVAQCAAIPVRLYYRGSPIKGAQLVDCMSHPKFRGIAFRKKGIFAITVQTFFDVFTGCDSDIYLFGFPGKRHYLLGKKLLGYSKTHQVVEAIVLPPRRLVDPKKYLFRITRLEGGVPDNLLRKISKKHRYPSDLCVMKDFEYLKWRYIEIPHKSYNFLHIRKITGKEAICVIDETHEIPLLLDVVGNLHPKESLEAAAAFLDRPLKLWLPDREDFLTHLPEHHITGAPRLEVIAVGRSFCQEVMTTQWANDNFFYSMGDSDLF